MLIAAQHLVDRLRQPRSRADELRALRDRLNASRNDASSDERALASSLRAQREHIARATGALASCAGCARGSALPAGRWDGGHCCSGATGALFDDDEVAALALAGTRPGHLRPPHDDHAGCAFRGATGCSLDPGDRPNRCTAYLCRDASRELHARGALDELERLSDTLSQTFSAFVAARTERSLDALLGTDD